jgi:phospholipid/cholesterol/gamma-HCH transport system substrate-binding protein
VPQTSLEVRVGLFVLAALVLLGVTVFVMSGVSLTPRYDLYVDFENPGSVQPGAAVRIGGIKVGVVDAVQYLGGGRDPRSGRRALVRLHLRVDESVKSTIHDDALFYVTAQGVLGEQFLAIEPGGSGRPLPAGSTRPGVDPPRLDLALALGYELLETITSAVRDHRTELRQMMDDLLVLLSSLGDLFRGNRERIDRIIENVEVLLGDTRTLVVHARERYVDGPEAQRILARLDTTLGTLSRDVGPLISDVRGLTTHADEAIGTFGPAQRDQVQRTIASAAEIAERASRTIADTQHIVAEIKAGHGTVGALLVDDEIYDDMQELVRDLKHNPWKFFWRE